MVDEQRTAELEAEARKVARYLEAEFPGDPHFAGLREWLLAAPRSRVATRARRAFRGAAKAAVTRAYEKRQSRDVHPEGEFDRVRRWYPSRREEAGDIVGVIRAPSVRWPNSYIRACRSRSHVAVLVARLASGRPVPPDIAELRPVLRAGFLARYLEMTGGSGDGAAVAVTGGVGA